LLNKLGKNRVIDLINLAKTSYSGPSKNQTDQEYLIDELTSISTLGNQGPIELSQVSNDQGRRLAQELGVEWHGSLLSKEKEVKEKVAKALLQFRSIESWRAFLGVAHLAPGCMEGKSLFQLVDIPRFLRYIQSLDPSPETAYSQAESLERRLSNDVNCLIVLSTLLANPGRLGPENYEVDLQLRTGEIIPIIKFSGDLSDNFHVPTIIKSGRDNYPTCTLFRLSFLYTLDIIKMKIPDAVREKLLSQKPA